MHVGFGVFSFRRGSVVFGELFNISGRVAEELWGGCRFIISIICRGFFIYGVCSAGVGEVGVMRLSADKAGLKGAGSMVVVMCIGTVG